MTKVHMTYQLKRSPKPHPALGSTAIWDRTVVRSILHMYGLMHTAVDISDGVLKSWGTTTHLKRY